MATPSPTVFTNSSQTAERTLLGHPVGLFLLFMVEMWERFSYYGMRALLVLYLTSPTTGMVKKPAGAPEGFNPGPGWADGEASTLYGWYTGLAYLTPVIGGLIADKLIGTHRSMVVGGLLIMAGHIALAISGMGGLDGTAAGMSIFIAGLAAIVIGTGHFKPSVSVMVGQLYKPGDPRRDGAFSIFYMGINLGAFLCAFVCGTLGERVGWHWGFGSAAVGMGLGLGMYLLGRPAFLKGVGEVPEPEAREGAVAAARPVSPAASTRFSMGFLVLGLVLASVFGVLFHFGALKHVEAVMTPWVVGLMAVVVFGLAGWFIAMQRPVDRGPVASIFIFMMFNAFFWLAFEQAGSSMTLFTDRYTDTSVSLPSFVVSIWDASTTAAIAILGVLGVGVAAICGRSIFVFNRSGRYVLAVTSIVGTLVGMGCLAAAILKSLGYWPSAAGFNEIPTTWFQSVNSAFIILLAPAFASLWVWSARRKILLNQPIKIGMGLILLGLGFVVLVMGARTMKVGAGGPLDVVQKAAVWYILATYLLHTLGELALSPTGLSYVTKAAPVRFVSLLMGIWFVSSFIANLSGGLIAAQTEKIEKGQIKLPWNLAEGTGSVQADFFFVFVVTSIGAGVLILALTPVLMKLMRNRND